MKSLKRHEKAVLLETTLLIICVANATKCMRFPYYTVVQDNLKSFFRNYIRVHEKAGDHHVPSSVVQMQSPLIRVSCASLTCFDEALSLPLSRN